MTSFLRYAIDGWAASRLFLAWRWRTARSFRVRVAVAMGLLILGTGIIASGSLGWSISISAQDPESVAGPISRAWVGGLAAGIVPQYYSIALGSIIAISLFGPFLGTATQAMVPTTDLDGMRPAPAHRYFDSLFLNAFSGLGIIQLLTLTGVASLLTVDLPHLQTFLLAWGFWFTLIAALTAIGWVIEYVTRRFGRSLRFVLMGLVVAGVGSLLYFSPDHGNSIFGLSPLSYNIIRGTGKTPWSSEYLTVASTLAAVSAISILIGLVLTRLSGRYQPHATLLSRRRMTRNFPSSPLMLGVSLLGRLMGRIPQIRRPILVLLVMGTPTVWLADPTGLSGVSIAVAVPMAIALSWAANAFGLFGTSMSWLSSQPKVLNRLLPAAIIQHVLVSMVTVMYFVAILTLRGVRDAGVLLGILGYAGLATFTAAAVAAALSVFFPKRTPLASRNDAIVPPLVALTYLAGMAAVVIGPSATIVTIGRPEISVWIVAVTLIASLLLFIYTFIRWSSPKVKARVVNAVSPD